LYAGLPFFCGPCTPAFRLRFPEQTLTASVVCCHSRDSHLGCPCNRRASAYNSIRTFSPALPTCGSALADIPAAPASNAGLQHQHYQQYGGDDADGAYVRLFVPPDHHSRYDVLAEDCADSLRFFFLHVQRFVYTISRQHTCCIHRSHRSRGGVDVATTLQRYTTNDCPHWTILRMQTFGG